MKASEYGKDLLEFVKLELQDIHIKNYGLWRFKNRTVENFTTDYGIYLRKIIHPILRKVIGVTVEGNIVVDQYPKLEKHEPYIFVSTHRYIEDPNVMLSVIDRPTYLLFGTTDQLEYNKQVYAAWAFGLIYTNRVGGRDEKRLLKIKEIEKEMNELEDKLRSIVNQDSDEAKELIDEIVKKYFETEDIKELMSGAPLLTEERTKRGDVVPMCKRVLDHGSSVLIYAEACLNNIENSYCQNLYRSPYFLAKQTNCKVVPASMFRPIGSKNVYVRVGDPIDMAKYNTSEEGLQVLKEAMGSLFGNLIYDHGGSVKRSELGDNPKLDFMRQRRDEYFKTKWTRDAFDEEMARFLTSSERGYEEARSDIAHLELNTNNAFLAKMVMAAKKEESYDFTQFMHDEWKKAQEEKKEEKVLLKQKLKIK